MTNIYNQILTDIIKYIILYILFILYIIFSSKNKQYLYIYIVLAFKFLKIINPVQFPLHEPYFDLTPIRIMHTKAV